MVRKETTWFSFWFYMSVIDYVLNGKIRSLINLVFTFVEMLSELSRREKHAHIKPDPDIDIFMKVRIH